jgi:hypothetical protein
MYWSCAMRRAAFVSGAIERMSMAQDQYIQFATRSNPVPAPSTGGRMTRAIAKMLGGLAPKAIRASKE